MYLFLVIFLPNSMDATEKVRPTFYNCIPEVYYIFGSSTTQDRSTMHPKFDPTGVQTHDLQIMTVHFTSLRRLL